MPEGKRGAVEQGEDAQHEGIDAEAHGGCGSCRQEDAGGHRDAAAETGREEPRGNVADHGAGAAGGKDEATEKDTGAEFVGELGDGRDDHPLADAEEQSGEVDAAYQRPKRGGLRETLENAHPRSLRGSRGRAGGGEGREGIVYASKVASGRGAAW